eukprot:scaffold50185_cov59-Phaeocystis_antarctica.AAC.2
MILASSAQRPSRTSTSAASTALLTAMAIPLVSLATSPRPSRRATFVTSALPTNLWVRLHQHEGRELQGALGDQYRELKAHAPTGGFQGMFDKGDLKFLPPIITCWNVIDETAPIREQVTSVDLTARTVPRDYPPREVPLQPAGAAGATRVKAAHGQSHARAVLRCRAAAEVQERGRDYTRSRWVARCAQTFFRTVASRQHV